MSADLERINNTLGKMAHYLGNHNSVAVSVSGGSDSDIIVHMICTNFRAHLEKIHFVFADTGLEWKATKDHLNYLEERYGITIDRVRGMPVVLAVRKYGVPIISKQRSSVIRQFLNGARCATELVEGVSKQNNGKLSAFNFNEKQKRLAHACRERGIAVSSMCCDKSKKAPLTKYAKDNAIDLTITGERRAEGGVRAVKHKSCFEPNGHDLYDKYMPLFFWDNETKAYYKERENIRYSDCYEVYGMKRTGCVGCPYNSKVGEELKLMKCYQPNLYKACMNVFGVSYKLMDEFQIHRQRIFDDEQLSLFRDEQAVN